MSAGPEKELNDLERALGKLVPQPSNLVRDRVLFAAGQMQGRRTRRLLAACAVAFMGLSLFLGYQLWTRPVPTPEVRTIIVRVTEPAPVESAPEPPTKERVETLELSIPPLPPVHPGAYAPEYGTVHRNIPHFGERALPSWPPFIPHGPAEDTPTRLGSRPSAWELPSLFPRR